MTMTTATEATRGRVLVIDDDRGPRETLRFLLKDEYRVWCADSVDAGMVLLREHRPDVVVMDIRMPGKNGIEGLREIRQTDREVAVLMFTGFGALETAQEAIRLGASDYLKKPFDAFDIQRVIRQHVQRVQLARRRQQAEGELSELNDHLRDELARKEHLAALGQKSAELVHDLRNPLCAVLGYVDLLATELRGSRAELGERWEETSDYLAFIEQSVLRCKELSDMWLDASRGLSNPVPVRVGDAIRDVLRDVQHLATNRSIRVVVVADTPDVTVLADRLQFSRALQNLAVNALEAAETGSGEVTLSCREPDATSVEIVVADNGAGMEPEQLQRVSEPFYTSRKPGGTGLGLFIARQVIEGAGGNMRIESRKGRGTRVIVRMPKKPGDSPTRPN